MEPKAYQKNVVDDLRRYLELMTETQDYREAFRRFWLESGAPKLGFYQDVTPGVPNLCFKIPTGGGKTFIACAAIRPLFDALPPTKTKAVVWLVPSDAILTQTLKALTDPNHPYRRRLAVDFGNRLEVYSKQELLNGQNFNPTTVFEQLSIMVLSYDSFRGRGEGLKAYQENGALTEFAKIFGAAEAPIPNADETSLFQAINRLNPVVIVDESHHARSTLSLEMLQNFNPSFVLDLTATPRKESNIISYVDAVRLKSENMVKLPVILYNRDSQADVLLDALDLRRRLEELAAAEFERSGRYVRPIALFQAQPKGKEDATTFEKLRDKLLEAGVPASDIAIRTADVDELKDVDLMSPECPIRCIVTVNALKEGWDCPFAYVLASLANKTSQIDVEQILGRVLRLPHARRSGAAALNMSYVLTSSNDFETTARQIVRGLNGAGFSERDFRLASPDDVAPQQPTQPLLPQFETSSNETDDFASLDGAKIALELKRRQEAQKQGDAASAVDALLNDAESLAEVYETEIGVGTENEEAQEVKTAKKTFNVNPQFCKDLETLLPQFHVKVEDSLFAEGLFERLDRAALSVGFTLKDKSTEINFESADDEIVEVDVRASEGGLPKVFKMSNADQRKFK
ncbi:MAG: DEAD/DEAH box helicase family protein, partial [Thermoguttaceae bacterium]|nr:DEAD/DEAH box helicase family protein [Thermoguttaceae bacterium]